MRREIRWKLVHASGGMLAAWMMRSALDAIWRRTEDAPSPASPGRRPASREPRTALLWALGTAVGVAVARVLADEAARRLWTAVEGGTPPETDS